MSKKYTRLTAPVGGKLNFTKSYHPDQDKARAIEEAFSGSEISTERRVIREIACKDFSVLIPTHNGAENLKKTIPALISAIKTYGRGKVEVIIMDNASTDHTGAVVKRMWPSLRVIRTDKLKGMPEILNQGVKLCRYPVVMLLQDTVKVSAGFALPLLEAISDDDIFAAVPSIRDKTRKGIITSICLMKFINGAISLQMISDGNFPEPVYIPGLVNTACMFHKNIFNSLGGFDELFTPCYMEDLDLGYRAWKRGHRVVYCRGSSVTQLEATPVADALWDKDQELLKIKNYLIFMAKNITDKAYYVLHWINMAKKLFSIHIGLDKDRTYLEGWKRMKKTGGEIGKKRKLESSDAYFTDTELIRLFSSHPDNRIGIG